MCAVDFLVDFVCVFVCVCSDIVNTQHANAKLC